ncbi:DUF6519 domain-containing protein [Roseateles sp.]|uniref:DUF6519 domain-containing protein n=1 Tax=Roseateles sp. TaxID=1971397 RepID=UPI003266DCC7
MKGDFSYLGTGAADAYTGVLHQQGRVLLDRDWNAAQQIDARLRTAAAADTFGPNVLAVPAAQADAFKVVSAKTDGTIVQIELLAGRAWAAGVPVSLAAPSTLTATYLEPPLTPTTAPATSPASIAAGVRDALLLEVWEDTVNGFQQPADLIEPALGGPDTTERLRAFAVARLLRLGANEDCSAVAALVDGPKGRLTVSPAPVLAISGDCPLEAGGGYTGLEHYLYRVEVAEPLAGDARFKWSQFNGGLVGRGIFSAGVAPGTGSVAVTANVQQVDLCGLSSFYLEALQFDAALGAWRIVFSADAVRSGDGLLGLSNIQGTWPAAPPATGFFRLWNGIARVADFPAGSTVELKDGIRLEFEAPTAGNTNYRPGDYWGFPVRASGAAFAAPIWPTNTPPHGVVYRRVALAEITWNAAPNAAFSASFDAGEIEDCRKIFRPLTNQKICCTYNVGDGITSFGDFNSIEEALRHLPASGGEICLMPGLHHTNAVIQGREHVTIRGCGVRTKVTPRANGASLPIFHVIDSHDIELLHMDLFTLGGSAIVVEGSKPGATHDIEIAQHRILACTNAVFARNVAGVNVRHNRIRMLDKRNSGVGIYLAGDDSVVERNDIRLLPFDDMPPIDTPDDGDDPIDPTDPCARLEFTFANPRLFLAYVNVVWAVALPMLPLLSLLLNPYRALGGIQLGGGSERVKVLENTVVGGAGNGITLGAAAVEVVPEEPPKEFLFDMTSGDARVLALVRGPDGTPMAGVQVGLTNTGTGSSPAPQVTNTSGIASFSIARGVYRVTEGAVGLEIDAVDARQVSDSVWTLEIRLRAEETPPAPEVDDGFLYDIEISRNTVNAMGLSGIGVPPSQPKSSLNSVFQRSALAAAQSLLGSPVVRLVIRDNTLAGNLRNLFDNTLRAEAQVRGLGGISLGLVDDVLIEGNRIEKNGSSATEPACGIFVQYGEDLDIRGNQVLENGGTPGANDVVNPGKRGGILLGMASAFGLLAALSGNKTTDIGGRPAARVCGNSVIQPSGCALYIRAIGPLQINDNAFASETAGESTLEKLGGTVLIYNLGGVQNSAPGMAIERPGSVAGDPPPPPPSVNPNNPVSPAPPVVPAPTLAPATSTVPVSSLATSASRARLQPAQIAVGRAAAAQALLPPGNTQFNDNQSRTGRAHTAVASHLMVCLDDLSYQDNQSVSLQAGTVFSNALLLANTVRASGNRWKEQQVETLMSLMSLGTRANNSSFNQGDHCIIVLDSNPGMAEVQQGNQVLNPSALCGRVNMTGSLLVKPLG